MKMKLLVLTPVALLTFVTKASAAVFPSYTIEPDDYPSGAILDHVVPVVSLITALSDNQPVSIFHATASYDGFGYASTGTNVFGAGGVPFWNNDRRLRMDFNVPANFISIDFIGGDFSMNDIGRLDVFNATGSLLESYITTPRAADSVETMVINRPAGDIAWAVAYVPPGTGVFGRLDHLQFSVVPEPSSAAILLLGGFIFFLLIRSKRSSGTRGISCS